MKQIKIFLASPSDTVEERSAAQSAVDEINKTKGAKEKFHLDLLKWETDTYSAVGDDGQDVINKQIGDDYNIFLGVMWKKFGFPTKRADSATAEEFTRAYKRYESDVNSVDIMFYFNSSPYPQDSELTQVRKVQIFKKKLQELGIYHKSYNDARNFEKVLRMDLIRLIDDKFFNDKDIVIKENENENILIPEINSKFKKYLNDLEANFAHRRKDDITLDDIYISPDLKDLSNEKRKTIKTINLSEITDAIDVDGIRLVITGDDQSGKTSACKFIYKQYYDLGLFPVLLDGTAIVNNIRPDALILTIQKQIYEQYKTPFDISKMDRSRIVLIIDNFNKTTKGVSKYWRALIQNLESKFDNIVIIGNSMMPIKSLLKNDPFESFHIYNILEFGPKFRYELVNKWNSLGIDAIYNDPNEILRQNDLYMGFVKTIIGKNYISSYPFYLLSILQALEGGNVQNTEYSIHGFYYEVLINDSIAKAVKDKKEIGFIYNYLTTFAFFLFELGEKNISMETYNEFHDQYIEKHDIEYQKEKILSLFVDAKLLIVNGSVAIKEPYIYYFFVAKYIANEISNKIEIKLLVTKMCERLFRDEYANIMMFVTHLSKDRFIIDELIRIADDIIPGQDIAKLEEEVIEINNLIDKIPKQVLENVNVFDQRNDELDDEEERERLEKELPFENTNYDSFSLSDDISTIDFFAIITRSLKTIDILGQVAKKHWGEMEKDKKLEIVNVTYDVGLKTLGFYLKAIEKNSTEIVEHISKLIREKHFRDKYSLEKGIEETSKNFVFRLCFMSAFGITKRVSNAIGYDKLKNTFERVLKEREINSIKLIDLSIKLGYSSISTNLDLMEIYKKEMEGNKISTVVLQNLALDYMYMFDTDFRTKNRICTSLDISMDEQRKISLESKIKKRG